MRRAAPQQKELTQDFLDALWDESPLDGNRKALAGVFIDDRQPFSVAVHPGCGPSLTEGMA